METKIEMFRKKEKEYEIAGNHMEKVQGILESASESCEDPHDKQGWFSQKQRLHQKYQAYTAPVPKDACLSHVSEVKAQCFLRRCHIIDSPDVIFKAVELLQEGVPDLEQRSRKVDPIELGACSVKLRFKQQTSQRRQYQKLILQMQQEITNFSNHNQDLTTDVFVFKQQLLNVYFERILARLGKECKEKAMSIQILWNNMIDMMENILRVLLAKIEREERKQSQEFKSVHQEINCSIKKAFRETHKLKQKLQLKEELIAKFNNPGEGPSALKPSTDTSDVVAQSVSSLQWKVSKQFKDQQVQTVLRKEKEETKKHFASIGVTCKPSKFQKEAQTQTEKQLHFDINCLQLTLVCRKPKKTSLQEKQTTKNTQTEATKQQEYSSQTDKEDQPRSIVRKKTLRQRDSTSVRKSLYPMKPQQQQQTPMESSVARASNTSHPKRKEYLQQRNSNVESVQQQDYLIQQSDIVIVPNNVNVEMKTSNPKPRHDNRLLSSPIKKHKRRETSMVYSNIRVSLSTMEKQPEKDTVMQWKKQNQKKSSKRLTPSQYKTSKSSHVQRSQPSESEPYLEPVLNHRRAALIKVPHTFDQQVQNIIQVNCTYPATEDGLCRSRLKEHIYVSFFKKLQRSSKKVGAPADKISAICKTISELYSMCYQKKAKGKTLEFVEVVYEYFAISYGAHNKPFVVDKVSCFLVEAKQLETVNIHIELFCLMARLTKRPDNEYLCPDDFHLCIILFTELNCDKKGFNIQTNYTTTEKLKLTCEPLIAKCVGKGKAEQIVGTMSVLITRSLSTKEDKDNYRISVGSAIVFVINRIAKQRSQYQRELLSTVRLFRLPSSSSIQTCTIDILLKYLNVNKKLYINSNIYFRSELKGQGSTSIQTFISCLMKIDYPLPQHTKEHLFNKFKFNPQRPLEKDYLPFLNALISKTTPNCTGNLAQVLGSSPSNQDLCCLHQLLVYYQLQQTSNQVLVDLIDKDLEEIFRVSLELLIGDE